MSKKRVDVLVSCLKQMVRCALPLALLVAVPASAQRGQWKVTLVEVRVENAKATGQPWDGDGSGPDIVGTFGVGRLERQRCITAPTIAIEKRQDTFVFETAVSIVVETETKSDLCVFIDLKDKDVMADDAIGSTWIALTDGTGSYRAGQASIRVQVRNAGGDEPSTVVQLPNAPTHRTEMYKITVVTARIAATKPGGVTWDEPTDSEDDRRRELRALAKIGFAAVVGIATGGAATAATAATAGVGQAIGGKAPSRLSYVAQTVAAPDPRFSIRWGEHVYATITAANTHAPQWDLEFLVPADVAEKKGLIGHPWVTTVEAGWAG